MASVNIPLDAQVSPTPLQPILVQSEANSELSSGKIAPARTEKPIQQFGGNFLLGTVEAIGGIICGTLSNLFLSIGQKLLGVWFAFGAVALAIAVIYLLIPAETRKGKRNIAKYFVGTTTLIFVLFTIGSVLMLRSQFSVENKPKPDFHLGFITARLSDGSTDVLHLTNDQLFAAINAQGLFPVIPKLALAVPIKGTERKVELKFLLCNDSDSAGFATDVTFFFHFLFGHADIPVTDGWQGAIPPEHISNGLMYYGKDLTYPRRGTPLPSIILDQIQADTIIELVATIHGTNFAPINYVFAAVFYPTTNNFAFLAKIDRVINTNDGAMGYSFKYSIINAPN